jgi:succinyl-diaminopimelate desuccinylase
MSPEQLIEATKQLIAIPSTSDNLAALQEAVQFVADLIQTYCPQATVECFEQNGKPSLLAYRGAQRPAKFDILLNGHVDVVPAPAEQFSAHEKDGKLYGRGALDMKGTIVALTDAFCQAVLSVPYELALQIVSDEENWRL